MNRHIWPLVCGLLLAGCQPTPTPPGAMPGAGVPAAAQPANQTTPADGVATRPVTAQVTASAGMPPSAGLSASGAVTASAGLSASGTITAGAGLTATAVASPVPATSVPFPTPTPDVSVSASPSEQDLVARTNALRAENGLPPYRWSASLAASAGRHSRDMARTGQISHTGSDGSAAKQRVLDTGYPAARVGENIYGGRVQVDDVWAFWSTDPNHRPGLLSKSYTEIGVSVVEGKPGSYYFTMDLAVPKP